MTDNKIVRKIAVIFVTDVVGFSKLMSENELETLKTLEERRALIDDFIKGS